MACLPGSAAVEGFDGTAATVGTGKTAVVLVNGAGESACAWQGLATKAVDAGHRVYAFEYASDGPPLGDRRAELQSIVEAAKGAGAERVVTVGGSRGGCLALTEAATNADISAVAVVSCATAWNREDPTPLAPYLPKVKQPVLEVIATEDPDVSVAEVDVDSRRLPNAEMITAPGGAHGSILANDPVVFEQLIEFIGST